MLKKYLLEKRKSQRIWQVLVLLVLTMVVGLLFTYFDKKSAAQLASLFFCIVPLAVLFWDYGKNQKKDGYFFALILFIVLLALPQTYVRWTSPLESISELTFSGVPMRIFHKVSNIAYLVVLLIALLPEKSLRIHFKFSDKASDANRPQDKKA